MKRDTNEHKQAEAHQPAIAIAVVATIITKRGTVEVSRTNEGQRARCLKSMKMWELRQRNGTLRHYLRLQLLPHTRHIGRA